MSKSYYDRSTVRQLLEDAFLAGTNFASEFSYLMDPHGVLTRKAFKQFMRDDMKEKLDTLVVKGKASMKTKTNIKAGPDTGGEPAPPANGQPGRRS